jgi:hypothetical protein
MAAHGRGDHVVRIRVTETMRSPLSSERLFDLLADPRGCLTWHDHPMQARPTAIDAPPGLALGGTIFIARGRVGSIACSSTTTVTIAEKPRRYETASVMTFEHPRAPAMSSTERFVIDGDASGCLVQYETEMSRDLSGLEWLGRTYLALVHRLLSARGLKRCFRDLMLAAEREAARAAVAPR